MESTLRYASPLQVPDRSFQPYVGRCEWCGRVPRLRIHKDYATLGIRISYRCHFMERAFVHHQGALDRPEVYIHALRLSHPFPLPRVPARLSAVRPRGYVVQADGTKAWVMAGIGEPSVGRVTSQNQPD